MNAREFFNFLREADPEEIVKKAEEAKKFFPETHYNRFLDLILDIKEGRFIRKINTYSYIIFEARTFILKRYYIIMYDPDKDILYCDDRLLFAPLKSDIETDIEVIKYIFQIPEGFIRVQGDLYVNFIYKGAFEEIIRMFTLSYIQDFLKDIREIVDSLVHGVTPLQLYVYAMRHYIKSLIYHFEKLKIQYDEELMNKVYKRAIEIIRNYEEIKEYMYYTSLFKKIKSKLKGIITLPKYRRVLSLIFHKGDLISSDLEFLYLPYSSEDIEYYPIYNIIDYNLQTLIINVLSNIKILLSFELPSLIRNISYSIAKYLIKNISRITVNIKEEGGRPHKITFIGISNRNLKNIFIMEREITSNTYLILSDIIIEHPEHGKMIIPINGYNPLYMDLNKYKKMERESIINVPAALVRFRLL